MRDNRHSEPLLAQKMGFRNLFFGGDEVTSYEFLNLTPFRISILVPGSLTDDDFEPCGTVAKVNAVTVAQPEIYGFQFRSSQLEIVNLPPPVENTILIVTRDVAKLARRADVFAPTNPSRESDAYGTFCRADGFESFSG